MEDHERYDANTVRKLIIEYEREKQKKSRITKIKKIWGSKLNKDFSI
jgi:hypothetical protein